MHSKIWVKCLYEISVCKFVGQEQGLQFSSWRWCSSVRITQMIVGKSFFLLPFLNPDSSTTVNRQESVAFRLWLHIHQYCHLSCLKQSLPLLFMFPAAWCSVLAQPFVQLHSEPTEILIWQSDFYYFSFYWVFSFVSPFSPPEFLFVMLFLDSSFFFFCFF